MSGEQTNGYDLVIEFAEQAYQELLTTIFDSGDFLLGTILGGIGVPIDLAAGFSVTVNFDQPAGLPAGATDVIDIHVLLGDAGNLGSLRIVASVDVDTGIDNLDLVRINLEEKLWLTEISVLGFPIPGLNALFADFLRQNVKLIPLVPFPVDRITNNTVAMKNADVRIVDDKSPEDRDASAFLVTFGGGTPGSKAAFTQSSITGGNAAIVASMDWICRVISPLIDNALMLNGAFTNCRLTRTVRIDEEHEVDLTELSVTAGDGALAVRAKVTKSGLCYSASGTVGARITIKPDPATGNLIVDSEVDDPVLDVDIPWYCWVAGAVIGALLGALLPSVIGVIVGAVLVPLIMYIAEEVIEGVVNSVAERIANALNDILVPVPIPAVGFALDFIKVDIDDIGIMAHVRPIDTAIVRSTGTVVVPTGNAFDLDSGRVGPRDMPSGDLAVVGGPFNRTVQAVCGARWARTGLRDFAALCRSAVYGYSYAAPNPIPLAELAGIDPFGIVSGNPFKESKRIYGVRTNDGRWAAVQAVEVALDYIRFRYITWEKALPAVQILGEFTCPPGTFGNFGDVAEAGSTLFVRSLALRGVGGQAVAAELTATAAEQPDPVVALRDSLRKALQPPAATENIDTVAEAIRALPLAERRIGTFVGSVVSPRRPIGRFDAATTGFAAGQKASWQLNGTALAGASGQVDLGGGSVAHYEISGSSVILSLDTTKAVEMLLAVTSVDDDGHVASAERCVHYEPRCAGRVRLTPTWSDYHTAWMTHYGVVEVPTPAAIGTAPR